MVDDEDQKRSKKAFKSLLKKDQPDTLQSADTIRGLLDDPEQQFSFAFVLNRCNQLLRAWAGFVLKEEATADADLPTSTEVRKARTPEGGRARALKKLQRARARLNEDVEDPLPAAVVTAAGAVRHRKRKQVVDSNDESDEDKIAEMKAHKSPKARGAMLEKKKSATRLNFTPEKDIDSENIEDPKEDADVLTSVKKRAKIASPSPGKQRKSQQKMYEGKRIWSDEEKGAVMQGIAKFGVGKWAVIKSEYCLVLKYRTSGQIKDCFRTLKKRGELDELLGESTKKESPPKEDADEKEKTEEQKEGEKEDVEEEMKDGEGKDAEESKEE